MEANQTLNWGIHGHSNQLSLLERAFKEKSLAHGYIFSGPSRIGKKTAARRLAQFLLCSTSDACGSCVHCRTLAVGSNADYIELSSTDDLKIESIRELGYKLSLKPYAAPYKVALIDNAHNLTVEASNALLKVLEEPKPHTLLFLITDNIQRLLPTITSRAQKINFGPLNPEEFSSWVKENNISEVDEGFIGHPGFALQYADADRKLEIEDKKESLKRFLNASTGEKLILAAELAEKETVELKETLEYWLVHLERMLRLNPTFQMAGKIRGVVRAEKLLDQNVNSKLLLSEMMIS